MIFMPATPGSQLKHCYMKEIKETRFKIRVVEQSGTTLKSMLQKSDPFKPKRCTKVDCLVCRTDGKGNCHSTGVTYELVCKVCCNKYIGETSRSACTLGREHLNALERREEISVMWRHSCDRHEGNVPDFVMNVTGTFHDDPMLRQVTESVLISKIEERMLINSKTEWNYVCTPRTVVMS